MDNNIFIKGVEGIKDFGYMEVKEFNAKIETERLIKGIRDWFDRNGFGCNAILGLSGGKDSTIVAALCAKAIGPERVYGFALPDGKQGTNEAKEIAEYLGIHYDVVNIGDITDIANKIVADTTGLSAKAEQNIPPRVRMFMLYAMSQSLNGRVIGTCNASENYIGYFTKYGDGASDFEPIANYTVHELYQIGDELGIPKKWTYKTPDDGLPNSCPDDEKFERIGFNYEKLDKYIRFGTCGDKSADITIKNMHERNAFKMRPVEVI